MRSLLRLLITLPVMAAPLIAMPPKPAASQTLGATEAVKLLATAKAADAKCSHLAQADREELSDYLARAEIASVRLASTADVRAAIAAGRSSGENALCGADELAEIDATLGAARQAMAAVRRQEVEAVRQPEGDRATRRRNAARPPRLMAASAAELRVPGEGGLGRYANQAMAYYVERRCRHLSRKETQAFWNHIVKRHAAALASNKRGRVAAALRGAEAAADGRACGAETAGLVKSAYAEIQRR